MDFHTFDRNVQYLHKGKEKNIKKKSQRNTQHLYLSTYNNQTILKFGSNRKMEELIIQFGQ